MWFSLGRADVFSASLGTSTWMCFLFIGCKWGFDLSSFTWSILDVGLIIIFLCDCFQIYVLELGSGCGGLFFVHIRGVLYFYCYCTWVLRSFLTHALLFLHDWFFYFLGLGRGVGDVFCTCMQRIYSSISGRGCWEFLLHDGFHFYWCTLERGCAWLLFLHVPSVLFINRDLVLFFRGGIGVEYSFLFKWLILFLFLLELFAGVHTCRGPLFFTRRSISF